MNIITPGPNEVIMMDGACGSLLLERGLPPGRPPDEMNLRGPDTVSELHRQYLEAGSEIILTNTFGSNAVKLSKSGIGEQAYEITVQGARLAKEAAGDTAFVAGDMGPTGELLEPYGTFSQQEVKQAFTLQVEALCEGGVDLIVIETMFDLREALLALEASLEATGLPVAVSLTFEKKATGFVTIMGNRVAGSFRELEAAGANAVGANCSIGSGDMVDLVREMVDATALPVIAQPNAGLPTVAGDRVTYSADPEVFAGDIVAMVDLGARFVGGCCGTNPDMMKLIREKLDARGRSGSCS